MSNVDDGPLANYNSLLDPHLSGFFSNTRIRKHLRKSGLVTRKGTVVTENQFRVTMARKEHRRHVRDLLATAIVHKTLDTERQRQAMIKRKLEEIAKIELVKRVKADRSKKSDETVLPYLSPQSTLLAAPLPVRRRHQSGPPGSHGRSPPSVDDRVNGSQILEELQKRPASASALQVPNGVVPSEDEAKPTDVTKQTIFVDSDGFPVLRCEDREDWQGPHPPSAARSSGRTSRSSEVHEDWRAVHVPAAFEVRQNGAGSSLSSETMREGRNISPKRDTEFDSLLLDEPIDTRNLYALDHKSLEKYNELLEKDELGLRLSPYKENLALQLGTGSNSPRPPSSPRRTPVSMQRRIAFGRGRSTQSPEERPGTGTLMLHRLGPAFKEQELVQSFCEVTLRYFGRHLSLERRTTSGGLDLRQEVLVEQQHCGGSTLIVFKELLLPKKNFTITSRRHRGYPFSLTFFIDGIQDARLSACCEYKHHGGYRLGGKTGHFGLVAVKGSAPCYRCQVERGLNVSSAPPRPKWKYASSPRILEEQTSRVSTDEQPQQIHQPDPQDASM